MRYVIPKGTGFSVGVNFYRAPHDMELRDVEPHPAAGMARQVTGYVDPIPDCVCSFMRPSQSGPRGVYVMATRSTLREV